MQEQSERNKGEMIRASDYYGRDQEQPRAAFLLRGWGCTVPLAEDRSVAMRSSGWCVLDRNDASRSAATGLLTSLRAAG